MNLHAEYSFSNDQLENWELNNDRTLGDDLIGVGSDSDLIWMRRAVENIYIR